MKKFLWILLVAAIVAVAVYLYVFHKPHRDIVGEDASQTLTAQEIGKQYADNQQNANAIYLDQVLEVRGVAISLKNNAITLEGGVFCNPAEEGEFEGIQEGDEVKVKGRVVSFDELFGEVRMDNCTLVQ